MFPFGGAARPAWAFLLVLLLCACSHAPQPQHLAAAEVPVAVAQTGTVSPGSTLGGIIVPFLNVQIQSNLVEPVDGVYVNEGDRVRRGEVLARLDTRDLDIREIEQLSSGGVDIGANGWWDFEDYEPRQSMLDADLVESRREAGHGEPYHAV